jgi:hypothetical protein
MRMAEMVAADGLRTDYFFVMQTTGERRMRFLELSRASRKARIAGLHLFSVPIEGNSS